MVVDSSIFMEIFSDGPARAKCQKHLVEIDISVPTLVLFEIYRKLKSKVSEDEALSAIGVLRSYKVLDLTSEVSLLAGDLSLDYDLAMADSFVLAHAYALKQPLLTMDNDFANIPGVILVRR
jgi:predicted nucleic acid-binding protein